MRTATLLVKQLFILKFKKKLPGPWYKYDVGRSRWRLLLKQSSVTNLILGQLVASGRDVTFVTSRNYLCLTIVIVRCTRT